MDTRARQGGKGGEGQHAGTAGGRAQLLDDTSTPAGDLYLEIL